MKIGVFITPNEKGQIVIPKRIRDELKITSQTPLHVRIQGQSIAISPIRDVVLQEELETSYYHVLKKTQGSWGDEGTELEKRKKRRKKELEAAAQNKKAW